jgi:hypothetical protein
MKSNTISALDTKRRVGVLLYEGRIYIHNESLFNLTIMQYIHDIQ